MAVARYNDAVLVFWSCVADKTSLDNQWDEQKRLEGFYKKELETVCLMVVYCMQTLSLVIHQR